MTTSSPAQAISPVGAIASKITPAASVVAGGAPAVAALREMAGRRS